MCNRDPYSPFNNRYVPSAPVRLTVTTLRMTLSASGDAYGWTDRK